MKEGDIYYYGARYYDPAIGRFMQADTIVPLDVQGKQAGLPLQCSVIFIFDAHRQKIYRRPACAFQAGKILANY
jgi:hypothetical protein